MNPPAIEIGDVGSHVLADLLVDSHRALHIVGRVKVGIDSKSRWSYGTDGPREVSHGLIGVIEVGIVDGKALLIRNLWRAQGNKVVVYRLDDVWCPLCR